MPRIKRGSCLPVAMFSAVLVTTPATTRVIGDDDRREPDAEHGELLDALGLIVCTSTIDHRRRRSAGTGTLVGSRDVVLTAAHVFVDEAGRAGPEVRFDPVEDCSFRQYDDQGNLRHELRFSLVQMGEFLDRPGTPNQDWAILKTIEPAPAFSAPLPVALDDNAIDDLNGLSIQMLAYHLDVDGARRTPLLSEGELMAVNYGGFPRLAHTADSGRMSSGAALIHVTSAGQRIVVGVNRSSANLREFNLAVPISAELEEALVSLAYGQVPRRQQRIAANSVPARRTAFSSGLAGPN